MFERVKSVQKMFLRPNLGNSMKRMYALALLFITFTTAYWLQPALAGNLPVVHDFTVEAKESSQKKAPILVLFMSSTCHYCKTVLRDFLLPMQSNPEYTNKVILRQIEISSKDKLIDFNGEITSQREFSSRHKVWAVPTVILFDSKGRVLTSIVGLLTVDYYLSYLDNAINESQEKIKTTAN